MSGYHHGAESRFKLGVKGALSTVAEMTGTTSYGLASERNTSESTTHSDRATRVTAGSIENGGIGIEGEVNAANFAHIEGLWGESTAADFEYLPDSITAGARLFSGTGRVQSFEVTCARDETVSFSSTVMPTGAVTYAVP